MFSYSYNPPLGTTPNAKIPIRTPLCCTSVPFGSKNHPQRCRNMRPTRRWRTSGRFFGNMGVHGSDVYRILIGIV